MKVDWQETDRDSFIHWFVPHVVARIPRDTLEDIRERSSNFTNVEVSISLNGVEVDAEHFLDSVQSNMKYFADMKAQQIVAETTDTYEIEKVMKQVRRDLLKQLSDAGIEIREDGYDYS